MEKAQRTALSGDPQPVRFMAPRQGRSPKPECVETGGFVVSTDNVKHWARPDCHGKQTTISYMLFFLLFDSDGTVGGRYSTPSFLIHMLRCVACFPIRWMRMDSIEGREGGRRCWPVTRRLGSTTSGPTCRCRDVAVALTQPLVVASRERDSNAHSAEILDHRWHHVCRWMGYTDTHPTWRQLRAPLHNFFVAGLCDGGKQNFSGAFAVLPWLLSKG
jgi:hypothetical protein